MFRVISNRMVVMPKQARIAVTPKILARSALGMMSLKTRPVAMGVIRLKRPMTTARTMTCRKSLPHPFRPNLIRSRPVRGRSGKGR